MKEHPHQNLIPFHDLGGLIASSPGPEGNMLMIQAGKPVDAVIEQLIPFRQGDIILDGGNSFTRTQEGAKMLEEQGIHYLGVAFRREEGGSFRPVHAGGNRDAYESVRPILKAIAKAMDEAIIDITGKMETCQNNGIEYADMQLIAESYLLLKYVEDFQQGTGRHLPFLEPGELHSYLIGITADIFREADDRRTGN